MKEITITISEIDYLNQIQKAISNNEPINSEQRTYLCKFLSQLPSTETLLLEKISLTEEIKVNAWDTKKLEATLDQWVALFEHLPNYDNFSICIKTDENEPDLLKMHSLVVIPFIPTLASAMDLEENSHNNNEFEIHLKDDGTAYFKLPLLKHVEEYPELYNFKGSWKEAYYLTVETMKKGWPMEEFPEELRPFLPKN